MFSLGALGFMIVFVDFYGELQDFSVPFRSEFTMFASFLGAKDGKVELTSLEFSSKNAVRDQTTPFGTSAAGTV